MTFIEFKEYWEENILPNLKHLRKGQSLMGYLHEVWPKEYNRISSSHYCDEQYIDCFYNDKYIPATFNHLKQKWKNFPF
jgi:hypothetical protein